MKIFALFYIRRIKPKVFVSEIANEKERERKKNHSKLLRTKENLYKKLFDLNMSFETEKLLVSISRNDMQKVREMRKVFCGQSCQTSINGKIA